MWNAINGENDVLMHYGVKGMKWGVRHEPPRSHIYRRSRSGKSIVDKWKSTSKTSNKSKYIRNTLFGIAAVSAATVVGLEVYKLGKMNADAVLKPGTIAQSIANSEKTDFGKSFYAATSQDDRRNILKKFSIMTAKRAKDQGLSGKVTANIFTNEDTVNIAGRKAAKKAYKSVYGTNKGFNKFMYSFGAKSEEKRAPLLNELKRRGYGGVKDIDGMSKWWGGETPIVLNGDKSGFKLRNRATINTDKLANIPVKDVGTKLRTTEENGLKVAKASLAAGVGAQSYLTISKIKNKNQNRGKAS